VQRLEGNPDCFGTANGHCERLECIWRVYCLEESQAQLEKKKEKSDEKNRDFV
jgi:hypothetical protein